MTEQEKKSVQAFLWSIRKTEIAIHNLERAIETLDTRRESPPDWMSRLSAAGGGGGSGTSQLESWTEFLEAFPARRSYLSDQLIQHKRKIEQYQDAIMYLINEPRWGVLGAEIIKIKYYQQVKPDKAIYTMYLFCAERTFYDAHSRALRTIFDLMPDRFIRKKAS